MSARARLALLALLAALGWMAAAFGLAITWVVGRFFATLLGWT
ncbi:hypothetical protein [Falsiroseomonas sp.]